MADELLTMAELDVLEAASHRSWTEGDCAALLATARAYHAKRVDPVAVRDQLAAELAGFAPLVANHHLDLLSRGLAPDVAQALTLQLHHVLLHGGQS